MAYRIAVASTDGKMVNQHFGRADTFYILEVSNEHSYRVVDVRKLAPVCEGGNHDENKMRANIKRLQDCRYLLVSRIGAGAEAMMQQYGITSFMIPDLIDEAVKKIIAHVEIEALIHSFSQSAG